MDAPRRDRLAGTGVRRVAVALVLALAAAGCFTGRNYLDPAGPRYVGPAPRSAPATVVDHVLQVATFNIERGERIGRALEVIRQNARLRDADILLLQEMDAPGTERIAEALGMGWVYYPATLRNGRGFGNAILSPWPITADEKLLLPHSSILGGTRRIATVATVQVEGIDVRVYSVHLATAVNQSWQDRVDQMETVLADASSYEHVVIGGDLNSGSIAEYALWRGYTWLTFAGPRTTRFARLDHILTRGFVAPAAEVSGTIRDNLGASDHLPVWARVEIEAGRDAG
jgi:endonuclease/exonuclease/phosphatase family metal-dependent hydrolase